MLQGLRVTPAFLGLLILVLSSLSCYSDNTSLGARPDLREIGERRAEAQQAATVELAEQDKWAPDTRYYWHRRQPRRIPLRPEDRATVHAALKTELESPEVDFKYVVGCVGICLDDEPSPTLEQLLFKILAKYPKFSPRDPSAHDNFVGIVWVLCQQGTVAVQEFMVELIAPDPRWEFQTAARRLFEATPTEEHVRLSHLAASSLSDAASLDFAKDTIEKASARLGDDSPYKAALAK